MEQQAHTITVPGRLCITGEHSDWAADFRAQNRDIPRGAALVVGLTRERLVAQASPLGEPRLQLSSKLGGALDISLSESCTTEVLSVARDPTHPWRFAAATAYIMRTRYASSHGISIRIVEETLPAARGFSSSAAVCVLVARAFNVVFKLGLTATAEMDVAYGAERMTGSACGRMDQIVAIGAGRVAAMTFDIDFMEFHPIVIPKAVHFVVADLGSSKDTSLILRFLQKAYPSVITDEAKRLRTYLGERNQQFVKEMTYALIMGDSKKLGTLMSQAQKEFDDAATPFCPQQLTAPKLHAVLTDEEILPLVYGGKGVGSQGDGAVQFVAKNEECAKELVRILHKNLGTNPTIVIPGNDEEQNTTSVNGRELKETSDAIVDTNSLKISKETNLNSDTFILDTAVIPTAGYGTRLFPAAWAVGTKGLLPIVDNDGFAKPILLHLVEHAVSAGMSHVTIVASPGEQAEAVRQLFADVPSALCKRLKPGFRELANKIGALKRVVKVEIQEKPEGFGHAVACAFPRDDDDDQSMVWKPFILLLGDVVFTSPVPGSQSYPSPISQVTKAFQEFGGKVSVIGVTKMHKLEAKAYGVVRTEQDREENTSEKIIDMIEKPDDNALLDLCDSDGFCDVILGPYALTGSVMAALKRNVKNNVLDKGEIQLTMALVEVMAEQGMRATRLQYEALDTGNARDYVRAFKRMGSIK